MSESNDEYYKKTSLVLDDLVRAKWLKSYISTPKEMTYEWTELGIERIKQLSDINDEIGNHLFLEETAGMLWATILRAAVVYGFRDSL